MKYLHWLFSVAAVALWMVFLGWVFIPRPLVVTLHAQTLPATKTLAWDANAASDGVTNYVVALDATTVGSPTGTTQPITFTTAGSHTLTLRAQNVWGLSPPATLVVNVVVPGTPANLRLQ